jgi:RsiW-degrading membrane proteinase PrsW (M82 family)
MFSKGAPESIMARCTHILCNDDGSSVPLTMDIRNELEARFQRLAFHMLSVLRHAFMESYYNSIILKYPAHINVVSFFLIIMIRSSLACSRKQNINVVSNTSC